MIGTHRPPPDVHCSGIVGRGEGPIPSELDPPSPRDREAARRRERLRATLPVCEDDTFPAKSPGAGPGERGRPAVEQRS
jgi:hypothetical protein